MNQGEWEERTWMRAVSRTLGMAIAVVVALLLGVAVAAYARADAGETSRWPSSAPLGNVEAPH